MNNTKLKTLAGKLSRQLLKDDRDGSQPASLISINKAGKLETISSNPDTYATIKEGQYKIPATATALALSCTGWAAPDDSNDAAPSLHPKRIRVALVITANLETGEYTSALSFANKKATLYQNGKGPLQDALAKLVATRNPTS